MLYDWQRGEMSIEPELSVPDDAAQYLTTSNSRLIELKRRYSEYQSNATIAIVWTDEYVSSYDLLSFRGDNCYVWQEQDPNCDEINYCLTTYYVKSIDKLELFEKNSEDGMFGVHTFTINGQLISRDLLDSINELNFLERELTLTQIKDLNILDIGAGYGRLAYRSACSLPNLAKYFCTDAVPESTFISEYHLSHRNVDQKVEVVPLDEIETKLQSHKIDIAFNIHSFSECSIEAIEWWVALLAKYKIPYVFIVPNGSDHGGEKLALNSGEDFSNILEKFQYKLIVRKPKYIDPMVQKYGVSPSFYYIFEFAG